MHDGDGEVEAERPDRLGFWATGEADPGRVAVLDSRGPATYGEMLAGARSIARGLRALGLRRGDHISMVLPNDRSFVECYFAGAESGLYVTPVNFHLVSAEIAYVLNDSEAAAVFVHAELADLCAAAIKEAGVSPERCFSFGEVPGATSVDELRIGGAEPLADASPGMMMMYTSGTTGKPKGVMRRLPTGNPNMGAANTAVITGQGFGIPVGDGVSLVCGPLYHAGPFLQLNTGLNIGHSVVLMQKFDPQTSLELIERHHVTDTQMVPTMFHRLLALPDETKAKHDLSSMVSVLHSGAPCPVDVKQRMMDWLGPIVYETYGGTEAAATIAKPHRWLQKPGTVGKPINGAKVLIVDDDGIECPPGTPGTIYIESDRSKTSGYFKDPDKTMEAKRDGAVTLGDIGYLDEDGFLFLQDRKIDMIISGGVNVYPAEVEAALLTHTSVGDTAVIGTPDSEWGERVHAIVEPADGVEPSDTLADELIAHCQSQIARFKCPRSVEFVANLPRLPNGKVEKRRLRENYWTDDKPQI